MTPSSAQNVHAFGPSDTLMASAPNSLWGDAWKRLRRNRIGFAGFWVIVAYLLVGFVGFLPLVERNMTRKVGTSYQPPTIVHGTPAVWFGTDIQGHSVFWQIIYGTRLAMTLAIVASCLSVLIGTILGAIAGYFGGWVDNFVIWLFSTVSNVPWILMVIAIAFVLKTRETLNDKFSGMPTIIVALTLTNWVGLCRLIRGEVLKLRDSDYVVAARAVGAGHGRILFRHILPNVFHLLIIDFSLGTVANVQAEVVLAFLGLGFVQKPSWGRMIDDSKLDLLRGVWWQLVVATTAVFIFSLAMNLFGDVLRDALDPRLRGVD